LARTTNKKDSIYFQLLRLLVISAFAAVLVFFILNQAGDHLIENFYYNSDYGDRKDESYIGKLQQYIEQNSLSSRDADALKSWVQRQQIVSIRVYKDGMQVFDSEYPDQELWEEEIEANDYGWEVYYTVSFADGDAKVSITGMYAYQFYNYAMIAELVLSFVLFLVLVLFGIRSKMAYILKLSDEVEILEGGSLDYKITVKGRDELAALAEGLDSMRLSFQELIRQEAEMVQENQKIVTEMSHDLRTPVTSIMLYTEILKKGSYKSEGQWKEYVEKIDRKARRMKQLTDHLFEYSLAAGEEEVQLEEPETCETLFYDLFSETCSYLEQQGFEVSFRVEWPQSRIRISTDHVMRIMDNLTSNIMKYADPSMPVIVSAVEEESMVGFLFENKVKKPEDETESNGIGIQSVKNMMLKMRGKCMTVQEGERFQILILFPIQHA
jgi:signal transduction histidine kinase